MSHNVVRASAVELVRVETADRLWLDGAWQPPTGHAPSRVEAFLLVHGTGSNFYTPGVLERFANFASATGAGVLRVNTRGHDGVSSIPGPRESTPGGAAFESVAASVHDLGAWLDFLAARGMSRVALVGHSMGGVKAIWFAAHVSSPQVSAVIALSPPRFCHESLSGPPNGEAYLAEYSRASQLVAEGRPETLLAVKQPLAYLVTASSYLDKHGPHDRYDFVRLVPKLACPLLVLVGSRTLAESQAFLGMPEALLAVSGCRERVDLRVVEGADIHYLNRREAPLQEAATWLSQVLPQ